MAQLRAESKRGFLRYLWRKASASQALTLKEALEAFADQSYEAVQTGRVIVSTSGGGYSTTFDTPQLGRLTQEEAASLSEEFIARYEEAEEAGKESDADIVAEMLDRLRPIRSVRSDFTALRLG